MSLIFKRNTVLATIFSLSLLTSARADSNATASSDNATASQSDSGNASTPAAASVEGPVSRWLELDALNFSIRYRNSFDTDGSHIFDDIQQRSLVSGKFKLDKQGKYFIGFRATSGRYFNWSYANFSGTNYETAVYAAVDHLALPRQYEIYTAAAADPNDASVTSHLAANGWQFYMRDLYLSATPVKGVTVEFGSIPIERGVASEITTFDEDGYIAGERVRVQYPHQLFLDQVEFTSAYLGDIFTPNFFDRYDRLTQSNYRQVMGEKHFGSRLKASFDYTWLAGTHTLHEAVLASTRESRVVDSARFELYQRTNALQMPGYLAAAGNGWAFTGTKHFAKRVTLDAGYADIDQDNGVYSGDSIVAAAGFSLNGDSYQIGKRFFGRANVKVLPGVSLFGFYTHQIDSKANPLVYTFTRQNLNFGLQLDFKAMLEKAHVL